MKDTPPHRSSAESGPNPGSGSISESGPPSRSAAASGSTSQSGSTTGSAAAPGTLTHLDPDGDAAMVDVGDKDVTLRSAVARGVLRCSPAAFRLLAGGANPKGDVQQVARVAGIMAGKRTGELIPLCHILPAASVSVEIEPDPSLPGLRATATARIAGRTGVEMEALTAVTVALLAAYDMLKAADRGMTIESVELVEKAGGRSGEWRRD